MSHPRAVLELTERDLGDVHVVAASGELDLAGAVDFCARVDAARRGPRTRVLVDLTGLEFCDSSGLRALIGASREMLASGRALAIVPPAEGPVADLFALAGVHELAPLRSGIDDALAALRRRQR